MERKIGQEFNGLTSYSQLISELLRTQQVSCIFVQKQLSEYLLTLPILPERVAKKYHSELLSVEKLFGMKLLQKISFFELESLNKLKLNFSVNLEQMKYFLKNGSKKNRDFSQKFLDLILIKFVLLKYKKNDFLTILGVQEISNIYSLLDGERYLLLQTVLTMISRLT